LVRGGLGIYPAPTWSGFLSNVQTPDLPPTVWHHGNRSYSLDGHNPVTVSDQQNAALAAFLSAGTALDTRTLETCGISNVSRVMAEIEERFPGTVRKPVHRGEGYFVRVLPAPQLP
jgi:hypothetical protein